MLLVNSICECGSLLKSRKLVYNTYSKINPLNELLHNINWINNWLKSSQKNADGWLM